MTMHSKIWKLEITSFAGVAFGAMHCYAALIAPDDNYERDGVWHSGPSQKYRVERVLTAETAEALNTLNERFGRGYAMDWEAGQSVHQFDTEEDAERYGIAAFNFVCDDPGAVLLRGFNPELNPSKPLAGKAEALEVLRPIWEYDETETSNQWTEIREKAGKDWDAAIKDLRLDDEPPLKHVWGADYPKEPNAIILAISEVDGELIVENKGEW